MFFEFVVDPKKVAQGIPLVITAFPVSFGRFLALQTKVVLPLLVITEMVPSITSVNAPFPSRSIHPKSFVIEAALLSLELNPESTTTRANERQIAVNFKIVFIIKSLSYNKRINK
jgi:hypothetical protein